jgi:hypothetical protein
MNETRPPEPPPLPPAPAPDWLGRWSFGLAFVSTVAYFGASEGIRNFVGFLLGIAKRVLSLSGHGA